MTTGTTQQDQSPATVGPESDSSAALKPSLAFLKSSITTLMVGAVAAVIAQRIVAPEQSGRSLAPLLVFIIAAVSWYLVSRGKIVTSKYILAIGVWLVVATAAVFTGGVRAPALVTYSAIIISTAWLIHTRMAWVMTALTVVVTIGTGLAEARALLPTSWPSSTVIYAGDQIVVYILSATLAAVLVRSYRTQLDELNKIGSALSKHALDLGRSKAELQRAQSVAKVGSWIYDLVADEMNSSAETCRIFGLPEGTRMSLDSYFAQVHPDDRLGVESAWKAALQGTTFDCEHRILVRQSIQWIRQRAEFEFALDGTVIGAVGIAHDITERKQAEAALRQSQRIASIGNYVLDTSTGRWESSDELDHIFGITASFERSVRSWEFLIHPEDRAMMSEYFSNQVVGHRRIFDQEYRIIRRDDQIERWVRGLGQLEFDAQGNLQKMVGTIQDITGYKIAQERIQTLAFYDPLTALPNRRLLLDRLQQAKAGCDRQQRQGALMLVDLDNFKDINDALDHAQGDLVLQQVAKRLSACVRTQDTVARMGADQFAVLLPQLNQNSLESAMQAEVIGHKILNTINQPYQLDGSEVSCTASIGIALFDERHDGDVEALKRAEMAMYQAKAQGRNTLRFFDPKMQATVNARVALEASLRDAVVNDQLVLHYQPQLTDQGQITGVEALLRWLDPKRGMVSPAEFIPMAEETGLILPIGNWVLETACKQLAQWASQPGMAHLTVAVNVSAKQFHQRDFVDRVLLTLERTGAKASRLKLELTESLLVEDVEGVIVKMNALKARGVSFSLDDFGTGYSSLSYLQRLPLDQLKIDQGFVRDILINPNDAAIAKMVVALAASLRLTVIPEGVETPAQRDFLSGLGCHNFQGYLFSRPLPIDEFEAFAART